MKTALLSIASFAASVTFAAEPLETSTDWCQLEIQTNKARWHAKSLEELRSEAKRGHAVAMYVLADKLSDSRDRSKFAEAESLRSEAAKAGLPQAILGEAFGIYEMTPAPRMKRHELFEKAAAGGYPMAQLCLAESLESGKPIRPDPDRTLKLMRSAADAGKLEAMTLLAMMYSAGVGDPRGPEDKPVALLTRAAELGHADALIDLAMRYRTGCGVQKDLLKSIALRARLSPLDMETLDSRDAGSNATDPEVGLYRQLQTLFEKAVREKDHASLAALAQMHLDAEHTAVNRPRAAALFKLAGEVAKANELQSKFDAEENKSFRSELSALSKSPSVFFPDRER